MRTNRVLPARVLQVRGLVPEGQRRHPGSFPELELEPFPFREQPEWGLRDWRESSEREFFREPLQVLAP